MPTNQHDGSEHHQQHQTDHAPKGKNMMAVFSYLWILILVPFLTDSKNDPFVKYHLKQGLVLIIFEVVGWIIAFIPFLGWIIGFVVWVVTIVLAIVGIMNVMNGQEKELPIIGKYAKNFNF